MFVFAVRYPCALRGSYATCKKFEEKLDVKEGMSLKTGSFRLSLWNVSRIAGRSCCYGR